MSLGHEDGMTGDENLKIEGGNKALAGTATFHTAGKYYIAAEYKLNDNREAITFATVTAVPATGCAVTITPSKAEVDPGDTINFAAVVYKDGQPVTLDDNNKLWFYGDCWNDYKDGNSDAAVTAGCGDGKSLTATVIFPTAGTYYIVAKHELNGTEQAITRAVITVGTAEIPQPQPGMENVDEDIFVEKVNISDTFIWGTDVSSVLANMRAGARYKDFDGNSLGETPEEQGPKFMKLLKDSGYNWIRLRIWNDPYNSTNHKGYGGANTDLENTKILGKWATDAGMKVLIDFHYSDFWADPGKQWTPKAWRGLSLEQVKVELEKFTKESLQALKAAGVNVGMVQVGNETNGHMSGFGWEDTLQLFTVGCNAVKAVDQNILTALHFADPHSDGRYEGYARDLAAANAPYDVFATSYYPKNSTQCTPERLTEILTHIATTYGKKVMVAETSYPRKDRAWEPLDAQYWYNLQGQADELVDTVKAMQAVGDAALGIFYWENAQVPVASPDSVTDQEQKDIIYYAGWASPYSQEYWDMNGEGANGWGGAGDGNYSQFDNTGRPLITLRLKELMKTGKTAATKKPMRATALEFSYSVHDTIPELPTTVEVVYNDRTSGSANVTWNKFCAGRKFEESTARAWNGSSSIDNSVVGDYTVRGTVDGTDGVEATAVITVRYPDLLRNPGLEESDMSMYRISDPNAAKKSSEDPYEGNYGIHFYFSGANMTNFTVEQDVTLKAGSYVFTLWAQGYNNLKEHPGATIDTYAYVKCGDQILKGDFTLTEWAQWTAPVVRFKLTKDATVTVGANVTSAPGAWGTLDNFYLYQPDSMDGDVPALDPPATPPTPVDPTPAPEPSYPVNPPYNGGGFSNDTTTTPSGNTPNQNTPMAPVITTIIDENTGAVTVTTTNPDGSSVVTTTQTDGTVATVATSATGQTETTVTLSEASIAAAQKNNLAVPLPIQPVQPTQSAVAAPAITVNTSSAQPVKVEIPAVDPTPGTVAVLVKADGTEEIIKTSVPTQSGVAVSLSDGATVKIVNNSKDFADVSDHWASDAVAFVSARELFSGTSATDFAPEAPMTRAMLMTVLARLDGVDTTGGEKWYSKGMEWATANNISDGSNPEGNISREQLAVMLWRYAGSPTASGSLSAFGDAGDVSSYAQQAMSWAVANGIIKGSDGQLNPRDQATRAQVAQMLKNFITES